MWVDKRTYIEGIVTALNAMAARVANAALPFAPGTIPEERVRAILRWRRHLVSQVRGTAIADITALDPPTDLRDFHRSLLHCLREPEGGSSHRSTGEQNDEWPALMMQLSVLCQEAGIPFPQSTEPALEAYAPEPTPSEPGDWRDKVRRALERRQHPDPDEAIEELESLRNRDSD